MRTYIILTMIVLTLTNCSWLSTETKKEATDKYQAEVVTASINAETLSKTTTSFDNCMKPFEQTIRALNEGSSFKPLFDFYKNHSKTCMDGAYAAGIEGAISEQLDKNWAQLKELNALFSSDSEFKIFFLNNIDGYVSGTTTQLEAVVKKAKNSCPPQLKSLCQEISSKAQEALDNVEEE